MIDFHYIDISHLSINQKILISWIDKHITAYNKKMGDINIIFCDDEYILSVNKQYLNHNYYTDIITFDYSDKNYLSGDLFISVERVKENAFKYKKTYINELYRVIIHGIFHLIGFNDKTKKESLIMRQKENAALSVIMQYIQ